MMMDGERDAKTDLAALSDTPNLHAVVVGENVDQKFSLTKIFSRLETFGVVLAPLRDDQLVNG
jgi:hypothetical protein